MSSGFITESEVAEARKKRQEEWEKVRQSDQPLGKILVKVLIKIKISIQLVLFLFVEVPEEPYDSRSLYERLKEQKDKRDYEYEEAHKLSKFSIYSLLRFKTIIINFPLSVRIENLVRGLDDDEVDFLEIVDKAKMNAERKQKIDEQNELDEFRQRVRSMQENAIDQKINAEIIKTKPKSIVTNSNIQKSSQKLILSGIVRKRKTDEAAKDPKSSENNLLSGNDSKKLKTGTKQEEESNEKNEKKSNVSPESTSLDKGALKCIGILPGIGRYKESSDSDKSTDTDDEYDFSEYDWMGRKIKNDCNDSDCH